ncbi:MAG: hypothetical protein K1X53_02110 [Candidatus Sumerlaeaceae bacterium]|nr:hypothetical protein [Candidatus Sumerlaeaceae bacterium]
MDNTDTPKRRAWVFPTSLAVFWMFCALNALLKLTYAPDNRIPYPVGLDSNCYYAFARSLFFDHDLNFANDYEFIARTQPAGTAGPFAELLKANPANPGNVFNAGTGIAALPFLAAAWVLDGARTIISGATPASGFSSLYVFAFHLASITYGAVALYLAFRMLRRWFEPPLAAVACWATLLCGPMLFYMAAETSMSHCFGAFFGTAGLLAWLNWRESEGRRAAWFALLSGVCIGFAVCIRPYNAPVVIVLAEPLLRQIIRRSGPSRWLSTLVAGIGLFLGFLPQMVAWKVQTGSWIANTTNYQFYLLPPNALNVLFARRHGLFFWAPAYLIALLGLVLSLRHYRHPAVALLAVFLGVTYMYGNWWYWWLGFSFGMRGYVDYPAIFAFGFAAAIGWIATNLGRRAILIAWEVTALFFIINVHLLIAFTGGVTYVDGPLYWLDTISHGKEYKAQIRRLVAPWSDFAPERRVSLFASPPP